MAIAARSSAPYFYLYAYDDDFFLRQHGIPRVFAIEREQYVRSRPFKMYGRRVRRENV